MNFRRNDLANALAQQGPPQMAADLEFQLQDALAEYQMGNGMIASGLNQGGWGGVGAALGAFLTRGKRDKQRGKVSTLMREFFNAQNNEEARRIAAEEQKAAAAQERQLAALSKRFGRDDAEAIVYGGLSAKDLQRPGAKYFKVGDQVIGIGPDGKASIAYDAPDKPVAGPASASPYGKELQAAVDAGLVSPDEAAALSRQKFGLDKPPNSGQKPLSAKDAIAAQTRAASGTSLLGSIDAAEAMLDTGQVNTGPIMGRLTQGWTEGAQKYQAEIGGILAELRRLQKTPGSGADSDRELDILIKQVPSMLTTEPAAKQILARLREKAATYGAGGLPQIIPNSSPAQEGWSIEEVQ